MIHCHCHVVSCICYVHASNVAISGLCGCLFALLQCLNDNAYQVAEYFLGENDYLSLQNSSRGIFFLFNVMEFMFARMHSYSPKYYKIVDSEFPQYVSYIVLRQSLTLIYLVAETSVVFFDRGEQNCWVPVPSRYDIYRPCPPGDGIYAHARVVSVIIRLFYLHANRDLQ